jgi:cytochrome b6-f complex iron-sulfur subunit
MTRKEFLSSLGIGAAFVLTTNCLQSCKSEAVSPADFTLNLDDAANANLKTNGGYIISNNAVVARTTTGSYVAATVICSHEGEKKVYYKKSSNIFECTSHGAQFDLNGKGLNSNGNKGLTIFSTELSADGKTLRVFS